MTEEWNFIESISAEDFLLKLLELGPPLETSIVGAFQSSGRGSKRDIELPLHRDGDYTTEFKDKITYLGLLCLREGGDATTLLEDGSGKLHRFNLKKNQALIINNKVCRHGREGSVGERLLLRVWI